MEVKETTGDEWGNLALIFRYQRLMPRSLADRKVAEALERVVADLRYGTVTVNLWLDYAYYFGLAR